MIDQWSFAVQVRRRSIRQCLVVQMIQAAIVLRALRLSQVNERTAQEFGLDFAGQTAGWLRGHLQLFVGVVVKASVLGYLFVGDADAWLLEDARILARLRRLQAQILEIIGALGVDQLNKLTGCTAIRIAQHAFHVVVIVFGRSANESFLIQARRQTGLLGAGVDECVVQAANDFVRYAFEGPWAHANVIAAQLQFDHVVHAGRSLGHGTRIMCTGIVLQLAQCLLGRRQWIDDKTEGGRLAIGLFATPALAFVQRQILDAIVCGTGKIEVGQFLECRASRHRRQRYAAQY